MESGGRWCTAGLKMACSQFAGGVKLGWRWYAEVVWNQFAGGVDGVRFEVVYSQVEGGLQCGWSCDAVGLDFFLCL